MTRAEALAEARRRWGRNPMDAGYSCYATSPGRKGEPYIVGRVNNRIGIGPSWEAAFADADRQAGVELLPNGIRLTVRR